MTTTTTLIIGATGKTGMPITQEALRAGHKVRAMIRKEDGRSKLLRSRGAETVVGDVHDLRSVQMLLKGVDKVYLSYPTHLPRLVEITANVARVARDEGIKLVVNMSQISVRENARSALTHQHWLSEQILDWSNVPTVHIRSNYFMENLILFNATSIAKDGAIYLPYGAARHAPIAARDIARSVVALLSSSQPPIGQRLLLTGSENLTIDEMAELIGTVLGQSVKYVDLPAEQWKDVLLHQKGLPPFLVDHLYKVALDHQDGIFDVRTDTVEELTGTAPQTLTSFIEENHDFFIGKQAVALGL